MLDIKLLRETPEVVKADLRKRGRDEAVVDELLAHDAAWRAAQQEQNDLRAERNQAAKAIAAAKKAGEDAQPAIAAMGKVGAAIKAAEQKVTDAAAARDALLRSLPNIMHESVPVGDDDTQNVLLRDWGGQPTHDFNAVSHVDLLDSLDVADLERAARAAGSRFAYLKGDLVLLARGLEFLALSHLAERGYTPVEPPYMLRREAVEGAVDLSDFEDVIYKVEAGGGADAEKGDAPELFLIATSEHPLAALHMGEILEDPQLPLKYAGVSPCFRKEAGAHGKDSKGIFRVHQFSKVEQFVYATAEQSWDLHEELLANAEALYQALGIPYRVVTICTGDLGTVAAKKYDIEAWMPVQGAYREVVSCSNCTDYQARRYNTRHRKAPGEPTAFVHTLNSTAIAVQRTLVAILENFQNENGSVTIPEVLRPYVGGRERIEPSAPAT
ncbi:MAG: serine--tRNA ligase [Thermoplasmatota archaeon]